MKHRFVLLCALAALLAAVWLLLRTPAPPALSANARALVLGDSFLSALAAGDPNALARNAVEQAASAGASCILCPADAGEGFLRQLSRRAAREEMAVGLVAASDAPLPDGIPLAGRWVQEESGYAPLEEGLPRFDQPDETGDFYAAWACGTLEGTVAAVWNGPSYTGLLAQLETAAPPDVSLHIPADPAIRLPAAGYITSSDTCWVSGTADPSAPADLNGTPVTVNAGGFWGAAVPLAEGENTFTLTQNGVSSTLVVTRIPPTGGTVEGPFADDSVPAPEGAGVKITSSLASLLADPADASSILQTVYAGACAPVLESRQVQVGAQLTYAYRTAGGWVRSSDCALTDSGVCTVTAVRREVSAREERLLFAGGSPAVLAERTDTSLTLTLAGASYDGQLPAGGFGGALTAGEGGLVLTLTCDSGALWGWGVDYTDEGTVITLRRPPRLSADPARPLEGLVVLLDPGHGGEDLGAMGPAGADGAAEKDLNLAAANAAAARLRQMGATVELTRTGDTFPTLAQRSELLRQTKPDIFVSVHHNSMPLDRDLWGTSGVECYSFYPSGQALAGYLTAEVSACTGRADRGAKEDYFYVTRSDLCPAVLLEVGFVPNPDEFAACSDPATLHRTGWAIAAGIRRAVLGAGE